MERTVFWVWFGVILYWIYCIFWGVKGFRRTRTASDYFIAGRQLPLLIAGIVVIGISTIVAIGGWSAFTAKLKGLDPSLLEVPGIMKFKASGPEWTGIKTLTYMFALMGIQAAPAFSMWAFSNRDTRPFPWQQAVASSLIVGAVLIFFTAFQGLGGQIMFQAGDISLPEKAGGGLDTDALVPTLMGKTLPTPLLVFTAIAAIAAMQSTGAAYMSTGGGMLTRDLFVRYIKPDASNAAQIWFGRLSVIFITVLAFIVAFISGDQLVLLGGLAVSYGFQMYPALIGALFWRRLTRQGIVAGLIAGIIAVSATYMIQGFRYPLTIHSAGWGILLNLSIAVLVSYLGPQPKGEDQRRISEFHGYLHETASVPPEKRGLKRLMWILTPLWFIFAIGPGVVLGSDAGSFPIFGLPKLWVWQIVWWAVGVVMMYMLAFKLEMSTPPREAAEGE